MISNLTVRSNLIPVTSAEIRYRYLAGLSAVELISIDDRIPEWGPFLRTARQGTVFGVPTQRQRAEWQSIKNARSVNARTRSRNHRWIINLVAEELPAWGTVIPSLNDESAIEYLWLTTRFMEIAERYLSSSSPATTAWTAKMKLQTAIQKLEEYALRVNDYVSEWLIQHNVSSEAQMRRIEELEAPWQ